ncbi:hypothetical protein [Palleronia caenipelagi]|uniref:hypothetical protein n=1 Tax=Palleronia caenipelagi TaxID=2489174 RepID=UPI00163D6BD3|nr:hypothetical protein [Palleronia caenipelagi]
MNLRISQVEDLGGPAGEDRSRPVGQVSDENGCGESHAEENTAMNCNDQSGHL